MFTVVVILHLSVCLFLIFIILIQSSKGAEMGAAFGGSSQTLFGSRGAATFLSKLTTIAAIVFMITSLTLAIISIKRQSVMRSVPAPKAAEKPFVDTTTGPLRDEPVPPLPASEESQEQVQQEAPQPEEQQQ